MRGISELLFTSDGLDGARKALLPSGNYVAHILLKPMIITDYNDCRSYCSGFIIIAGYSYDQNSNHT